MEDSQIIELYWRRSEDAITETSKKYGRYCHTISFNILGNAEDSEECVNDTYLKTWSLLPPAHPAIFSAFLAKITRNLSLDRYRNQSAEKRGGGRMTVALDELSACIPVSDSTETMVEQQALIDALDRFLDALKSEQRKIFLRRYWYISSIREIASDLGISESKVKTTLLRTRTALKEHLEKEGIAL